jgi:hypothetical protein
MKKTVFDAVAAFVFVVIACHPGHAAIYTFTGGGITLDAVNLGVPASAGDSITIESSQVGTSDTLSEEVLTLLNPVSAVSSNFDYVNFYSGILTASGNTLSPSMLLGAGTQSIFFAFLPVGALSQSFTVTVDIPDNLSPGVVVGLPEASTWAMLLIGFAGIGFAARRHRIATRLC